MTLNLTPELEQLVQAKMQSGRFSSASEVVTEALRLMEEHAEARVIRLEELHRHIDQSLAEHQRGEGVDGETFMKNLLDDLDSREKRPKAG